MARTLEVTVSLPGTPCGGPGALGVSPAAGGASFVALSRWPDRFLLIEQSLFPFVVGKCMA